MAAPNINGSTAADILKTFVAMTIGAGLQPIAYNGKLATGGRISGSGDKATFGGVPTVSPLGSGLSMYEASDYPRDFSPGVNHEFDVVHVPGKANNNALGHGNTGNIDEAGVMQSLEEHNRALLQFVRPGQTPAERYKALQEGREAEKKLPAYWNESATREGHEFQVSSSAVNGIRVTPYGTIEVKWASTKNPDKWYTFGEFPNTYEASKAAQQLLLAPSIGRAVMPFQRHGKPLKFKNAADYSWWNRRYYNAAFG